MTMKTLVIGLDGLPADLLLGDDRLAHVRHLMASGGFARLSGERPADPSAFWRSLDLGRLPGPDDDGEGAHWPSLPGLLSGDEPPLLVGGPSCSGGDPIAESEARLAEFSRRLAEAPWSFARLIDNAPALLQASGAEGAIDSWIRRLDDALAPMLERLGDSGTVLIASRGVADSAAVLATTGGGPGGEIPGLRLVDLAPMLLALAGRPIPPSMTGRAPDAPPGPSGDEPDDEQAVRDRLQGLGYL
ncbi:hypothetical protein [Tautonia sociabilis]|uniref:Metalloenzyme domain-containing protein n=1 Tax=Tautonia sociabilis TaxID=2080755 RepID=A0A432MEG1_9BACT|nr:hypothetical protein [Tautonia sociabilis]RUL83882.1 hypothetical protein TsocGM_21380 [Tautonia sociabilis]